MEVLVKDTPSVSEVTLPEYCGSNGYITFAGVHLIIELWEYKELSISEVDRVFRQAISDAGATLLNIDLHEFSPFGGISGVAVLQESHVSIHTWPEYKYAAMDIFVCGTVDPYKAIPAIKDGFKPGKIQINEIKRGIM